MRLFEQFCLEHPHFVRRLRDALFQDTPAKVVDFLADNQKLPSRYEELPPGVGEPGTTKLKEDALKQFPVLCDYENPDWHEPGPNDRSEDDFDTYDAARPWLAYAVLRLPPPHPEAGPGFRVPEDIQKYRLPKKGMMTILLRQKPAEAQTAHAERL